MEKETSSRPQTASPAAFSRRRAIAVLAVLILIFAADALGLFDGLNARVFDLSFRVRGVRPPSADIVLVGIDEPSIRTLGRWPLPRTFYAEVVDRLAEARVVGLDLILAEPDAGDAALAEAIRRHGRVVLAAYFDDRLQRVFPDPALSAAPVGHVHVERDIDLITRSVFHSLADASGRVVSMSAVMAGIFHKGTPPGLDSAAAVTGGSGGLVQADLSKINFYGPPGTFFRVSMADVLSGRYPSSFFSGKAVLIGATAEGLRDKSPTPFSGQRRETPGVEIQANILNNILDGSSIRDAGRALIWALNVLLGLTGLAVFIKVGERKAAWIWGAGLLAVSVFVYLLFVAAHIWLGPGILYVTSGFIFLTAYLFKLDAAARQLDRKYAHVAAQFGKAGSKDYGFESGMFGLFSTGGINRKIRGLLSLEESYERQLEEAVARRTRELAEALAVIKGMNRELILRLAKAIESRDESTGDHVARVGLYAQVIARAMLRPEEEVASIAFTSSIHDIGKIGIPDRILLKKGRLTPDEIHVMQSHTRIGFQILSSSEHQAIRTAAAVALNHHERWDGSGYPNGLKATAIPLEARIVAICDLYDALRSPRSYKAGFDHETAVRMITKGGGGVSPTFFDPVVLQAFKSTTPTFAEVYRQHQDGADF